MKKGNKDSWLNLIDTPQGFSEAIKKAKSNNERQFFEQLRYKILNEPAFSNDVLMNDKDNEFGIYIIRVCDDFLIGRKSDGMEVGTPRECGGLFFFLQEDMYPFIKEHITVGNWLANRDYSGINYDANNDNQ